MIKENSPLGTITEPIVDALVTSCPPIDAPKKFPTNLPITARIMIGIEIHITSGITVMFTSMPIDTKNIPNISQTDNPTGCYKRGFNIPDCWLNQKQVYVEFKAVSSAFDLWINGEYIGFSEGSMTPAKFNITSYINVGMNTISVKVNTIFFFIT